MELAYKECVYDFIWKWTWAAYLAQCYCNTKLLPLVMCRVTLGEHLYITMMATEFFVY